MKLPRGVSYIKVVRVLEKQGYVVIRRKGSHWRLRHPGPPAHALTVPAHNELKVGTLQSILVEAAQARSVTIQSLLDEL